MLERVVIVPNKAELGALGEALVYYGEVEVVLGTGHLIELAERNGIDQLIRLAESDLVTISTDRSANAVLDDHWQFRPLSFASVRIHATADKRVIRSIEDEIWEAATRKLGRGAVRRADIRRLAKAIRQRDEVGQVAGDAALADVSDQDFLDQAIRGTLKTLVPDYPRIQSIRVRADVKDGRFRLDSNIDFDLANSLYHEHTPPEHSSITPSYLLAPLIRMRAEMLHSGDLACDIWTDEVHSFLMRTKVNSFISRIEGGRKNIDRFNEVIFPGRSFSSAVNSGERSIIDVLNFAEDGDTRRFKEWLKSAPEGADLLAEYEKSKIAPSSLAASVPVKLGKLVLFAGVGATLEAALEGAGAVAFLASLATDAALGAADHKLLSRLRVGWRPNQWVVKAAGPFLTPSTK